MPLIKREIPAYFHSHQCNDILTVGKDADIVVYFGHPFHYLTQVQAVYIDGERRK